MNLSHLFVIANIIASIGIALGALSYWKFRHKISLASVLDGVKIYLVWLILESFFRWLCFLLSWNKEIRGGCLSVFLAALQITVILACTRYLIQKRQRTYGWKDAIGFGIGYGVTPILGYNILLLAAIAGGKSFPLHGAWISPVAVHCISAGMNWFLLLGGLAGIIATVIIYTFVCGALIYAVEHKSWRWAAAASIYGIGAFAIQGFLYFLLDFPAFFNASMSFVNEGAGLESIIAILCNATFSSLFSLLVLLNSLVFAGFGILGLRSLRQSWQREASATTPITPEMKTSVRQPLATPPKERLQPPQARPKTPQQKKSKNNKIKKKRH